MSAFCVSAVAIVAVIAVIALMLSLLSECNCVLSIDWLSYRNLYRLSGCDSFILVLVLVMCPLYCTIFSCHSQVVHILWDYNVVL